MIGTHYMCPPILIPILSLVWFHKLFPIFFGRERGFQIFFEVAGSNGVFCSKNTSILSFLISSIIFQCTLFWTTVKRTFPDTSPEGAFMTGFSSTWRLSPRQGPLSWRDPLPDGTPPPPSPADVPLHLSGRTPSLSGPLRLTKSLPLSGLLPRQDSSPVRSPPRRDSSPLSEGYRSWDGTRSRLTGLLPRTPHPCRDYSPLTDPPSDGIFPRTQISELNSLEMTPSNQSFVQNVIWM